MGRRKEKKTAKQLKEQQAKYREQHNSSRREKYAKDEEYRLAVHKRNRERYRSENKVELRKADAASIVNRKCKVANVELANGKFENLKCVDYDCMANVLGGYHKFVLHRWHRAGRFPRANKHVTIAGHRKAVYLIDEAKQLAQIMREHQKQKLYFTGRDKQTVEKLFKVMSN